MIEEGPDIEIVAMSAVAKALDSLDEGQRVRVLRWAADRFAVREIMTEAISAPVIETDAASGSSAGAGKVFASIDELFESGAAKTNTQKALLAAYWFQVVQDSSGFQSFTLNTALKNMGQGISNITDALRSAEVQKPALVMQTGKTGKSRQARKTYKLTTAGVKFVESMLEVSRDD